MYMQNRSSPMDFSSCLYFSAKEIVTLGVMIFVALHVWYAIELSSTDIQFRVYFSFSSCIVELSAVFESIFELFLSRVAELTELRHLLLPQVRLSHYF